MNTGLTQGETPHCPGSTCTLSSTVRWLGDAEHPGERVCETS